MTKVLKADISGGSPASATKSITFPGGGWYVQFDVAIPTATFAAVVAGLSTPNRYTADFVYIGGSGGTATEIFCGNSAGDATGVTSPATLTNSNGPGYVNSVFTADTWHTVILHYDGSTIHFTFDGVNEDTPLAGAPSHTPATIVAGAGLSLHTFTGGSQIYYIRDVRVGTTLGGTQLFSDNFASGNLSAWTSTTGSVSVVADPFAAPPVEGRILIAWDDGPLEPNPTWTVIDQGGDFPENFVSGYDTHSGRQTLISQTETGTATVYVNDREGLFDDRNGSSPYQGKLSGRQIMLQLYNPVNATWYSQFRGLIDDYRYTMDGSAVGADGNPVVADIEIDCVDMFDYLNGYGLTPGIDGTTPPAGAEDSVYFAASGISDTVEDRILEILGNANIDPAMSITASGNVQVIATQYNADESALTALRDAADAELPFIANIYVNRSGQFCFRGRYSSFAPDQVAAEAGSTWDFHRWKVGDGKAIQADPTRAQIRLLSYSRDRNEIINAAMCYPQGTPATAIPDQVYGNTVSIAAYGKHQANPMTDLITGKYVGFGTITPDDGQTQCYMYAELLVKNKKDPRLCPTAVQLKSIQPTDARSSATWDILTRSDISDIVNIAVGYAGGTGLMGAATVDDYYIQGRALTVRPANTGYDEVELDLEVTPFIWSADTNGVFPAFGT